MPVDVARIRAQSQGQPATAPATTRPATTRPARVVTGPTVTNPLTGVQTPAPTVQGGADLGPLGRVQLPADIRAALGRNPTHEQVLAGYAEWARRSRPGGITGFIGNVGRNIQDIATGLPHMAALLGEGVGAVGADLYSRIPLPGLPGQGAAADWRDSVGRDWQRALGAIAEDYSARYGPLYRAAGQAGLGQYDRAQSSLGEFASQLYEKPVFFALDLGAAYSGAGLGLRGAARLTPEGSAFRAFTDHSRLSPARARPDRVLTERLRVEPDVVGAPDAFPGGADLTNTIRVPQRPRSGNPLTAAIQRRYTDPLRQRVLTAIDDATIRAVGADSPIGQLLGRASAVSAHDRAQRVGAARIRHEGEDAARRAAEALLESTGFLETTRRLRQRVGRNLEIDSPEALAVYGHVRGLLDIPGKSRAQAWSDLLDFWREGLGESARAGKKRARAERRLADFTRVPEELWSYDTLPAHVRAAVDAERAVLAESSRLNQMAGLVSEQAAEWQRVRPAAQVHGGSTFEEGLRPTSEALEGLRAEHQTLVQTLRALNRQMPTQGLYRALQRARSAQTTYLRDLRRGKAKDATQAAARFRSEIDQIRRDAAASIGGLRRGTGNARIAGAPPKAAELLERAEAMQAEAAALERPHQKRVLALARERRDAARARAAQKQTGPAAVDAELWGRVGFGEMRGHEWETAAPDAARMAMEATRNDELYKPVSHGKGRVRKTLADFAAEVVDEWQQARAAGAQVPADLIPLLDAFDQAGTLRVQAARLRADLQPDVFGDPADFLFPQDAALAIEANTPYRTARQIRGRNRLVGDRPPEAGEAALSAASRRRADRYFGPTPDAPIAVLERLAQRADFDRQAARLGLLTPEEITAAGETVRMLERELAVARVSKVAPEGVRAQVERDVRAVTALIKAEERRLGKGAWTTPAPVGVDLAAVPETAGVAAARGRLETARAKLAAAPERPRNLAEQEYRARVERAVRKAEVALREEQIRASGERFDPGTPGEYVPDLPVDPLESRTRRVAGGIFRRISPVSRPKRSHGTLFRGLNVVTDPRLAAFTALKAQQVIRQPEALARLFVQGAYRDSKGRIATDAKAILLQQANPERTVLVNVGGIRKALAALDELAEGRRYPELDEIRGIADEAPEGAPVVGRHPDEEGGLAERTPLDDVFIDDASRIDPAQAGHYIAISKAAADEWRSVAAKPGSVAERFDTVQNAWKRGVLAFTPRWYLYNLIGNAFQFGILSGGDLKAMRQARRGRPMRDIVPAEVSDAGLAPEVGYGPRTPGQERWSDWGLAFNNRLEGRVRSAAFLAASKRAALQERVLTRRDLRAMPEEQIARALDEMPAAVKEDVIREVLLYLGDYRNFTPFERTFLRRAFPFYSWLRVIGRLTFTMPIRSPLRAEALALLSEMGTAGVAEGDAALPSYLRGMIRLPGGVRIPTTGVNPFATPVEWVDAATGGDPLTDLARVATGNASPILAPFLKRVTGVNPFGTRELTFPAGYQGSVEAYGREALRIDPHTGRGERFTPSLPFLEDVIQTIPLGNIPRQLLAGADRTYDVATTLQLLRYRLAQAGIDLGAPERRELFWREDYHPPTAPYAPGGVPVGAASGLLGVPLRSYDEAAQIDLLNKQAKALLDAQRQTARRIASERGGG